MHRGCGCALFVAWVVRSDQAEVTQQQCPVCIRQMGGGSEDNKVFMLRFKFKRSSLMPGTPLSHTGCVRGHSDFLTNSNNLGFRIVKGKTRCTSAKCQGHGGGGVRAQARPRQRNMNAAAAQVGLFLSFTCRIQPVVESRVKWYQSAKVKLLFLFLMAHRDLPECFQSQK